MKVYQVDKKRTLRESKVVLFGAGGNGKRILSSLINEGIIPSYFIDNDKNLTSIVTSDGKYLPVCHPDALYSEEKNALTIIITPNEPLYSQIESQVDTMGFRELIYSRRCPACSNDVTTFRPFGAIQRLNAQCPHCFALERHRALWLYLKKHTNLLSVNKSTDIVKLLHFAPEEVFNNRFSGLPHIDYYPVDINAEAKGIRKAVDIQDIDYEDATFDVIICSHVLEHIENDIIAMKEMYRVLKNGGVAYICVPVFNIDDTIEDPTYNTPELRFMHYGQEDHLRIYGRDFLRKLDDAGFKVEIIDMIDAYPLHELFRYGLSYNGAQTMYKCNI
jgi:SAM-dependent methyltransferase